MQNKKWREKKTDMIKSDEQRELLSKRLKHLNETEVRVCNANKKKHTHKTVDGPLCVHVNSDVVTRDL